MKISKKICFLLAALFILLNGCSSDSHDPDFILTDENFQQYVPKISAYWVGTSSISSTPSIQFDYELKPIFNPSFWGIQIDKVVFYFDGTEISSSTKAPYTVKYTATNPAHGNHVLLAEIYVSGKNLSPHIIEVTHQFYNKY